MYGQRDLLGASRQGEQQCGEKRRHPMPRHGFAERVGVAAHPEPHPRSPSVESDRRFTAEKVAAADFAITQFFFEARHYFDLVNSLRDLGVDKPVIPGIMPVTSIAGTKRMAEMQGSEFPRWLADKLHAVGDDPAAVRAVGIAEATRL